MKKLTKKLIGMTTAAVMSVSMLGALPAAAEEAAAVEATETVKIGDFDCWVVDGMYFTEVDGEICQVMDMSQFDWTTEAAPVGRASEVDISDGSVYEGEIDISDGDDSTPTFIGYHSNGIPTNEITYYIHAGFVFRNTYKVKIHGYSESIGSWQVTPQTMSFGLTTQTLILYNGFKNESYSKVYIEFLKEGSTGEKQIGYSFYIEGNN